MEFLPLVRLRVLPAYAGVSGKTSFGIEQRRAIYHSDAEFADLLLLILRLSIAAT
ncbi:hypothetical protein HMPREF9554_02118 [Treponema phagedenis F0421]|nr:hypothetical protein HMPREF9554_02118 [Treponema phagedenis F0421]